MCRFIASRLIDAMLGVKSINNCALARPWDSSFVHSIRLATLIRVLIAQRPERLTESKALTSKLHHFKTV